MGTKLERGGEGVVEGVGYARPQPNLATLPRPPSFWLGAGASADMSTTSDAQLVNSVYLDNSQLELYHGRLDKTPGAIAIRLRWYHLLCSFCYTLQSTTPHPSKLPHAPLPLAPCRLA